MRTLERTLLAALVVVAWERSHAKVFLTQDQALRLAFGDAAVDRQTRFLTDGQLQRARSLAGESVEIGSALVTRYTATRDGRLVGTAYFDTHTVRTLPETAMIVVGRAGDVARIEILSFGEPEEYLAGPRWLEQFRGRSLDRELEIKRGIHGITGATLSARAITNAARRILAIHKVLAEEGARR